jgi:hypothetical protein
VTTEKLPIRSQKPTPPPRIMREGERLVPDEDSAGGLQGYLESARQATGTASEDLAIVLLEQLVRTASGTPATSEAYANAALAAMAEHAPRDITEALLASQMVAVHNQIMRLLAKAAKVTNPDVQNTYLNMAAKMGRLFASQADVFRRHRQNGQQKMLVEHVHVHNGGQAIVGHVTNAPKGEGSK